LLRNMLDMHRYVIYVFRWMQNPRL
jgi:hypothetical protein